MQARPSDLKQLLTQGDLQLREFRPALKIDWANFPVHVVVDKKESWVQRILFTPDDVSLFNAELCNAIEEFRLGCD